MSEVLYFHQTFTDCMYNQEQRTKGRKSFNLYVILKVLPLKF